MTALLIVDDDRPLLRALSIGLSAHGYDVHGAEDGPGAIRAASSARPDVILLDLGLPGLSGLDVIRAVRGWSQVPIVVLSARHQEATKVAALDAGADDYITKPFGMEELLARLRVMERRTTAPGGDGVVHAGDLVIDLGSRRVERRGQLVHLTPKEWGVLQKLAAHPGRLVTQNDLLSAVWGPGYEGEGDHARTVIARLRKKLEADPSAPVHLLTEPGVGYRFEADAD